MHPPSSCRSREARPCRYATYASGFTACAVASRVSSPGVRAAPSSDATFRATSLKRSRPCPSPRSYAPGPDPAVAADLVQVHADAQAVVVTTHRAPEQQLDVAEFARDLQGRLVAPLVVPCRDSRDHSQRAHLRQGRRQLFRDPVREPLLLRIAAEVLEREHRQRPGRLPSAGERERAPGAIDRHAATSAPPTRSSRSGASQSQRRPDPRARRNAREAIAEHLAHLRARSRPPVHAASSGVRSPCPA